MKGNKQLDVDGTLRYRYSRTLWLELSDKVYILNVYGTCNKKEHKLRKQVIIKNFQLFLKKNGKNF